MDALIFATALLVILAIATLAGAAESRDGAVRGDHDHSF